MSERRRADVAGMGGVLIFLILAICVLFDEIRQHPWAALAMLLKASASVAFVVLVLRLLATPRLARLRRQRHDMATRLCLTCGYDLGGKAPTCPTCGGPFSRAA